MNHENQQKSKFFCKPPITKVKVLSVVFLWIALWNVVYQFMHAADMLHFEIGSLHLGVENWAFFAAVTLFFMQEELSYKDRFWHTLVGGSVGTLMAAGLVFLTGVLMKSGLGHASAVSIPLMFILAILIIAHPYVPMVFNNVGFIYFIFSLVKSDVLLENLPSYLFSLVLGSVILNLGCSFLIGKTTKILASKKK